MPVLYCIFYVGNFVFIKCARSAWSLFVTEINHVILFILLCSVIFLDLFTVFDYTILYRLHVFLLM